MITGDERIGRDWNPKRGDPVEIFIDGKNQGNGVVLAVSRDLVKVGFADGQVWEYAREKVRIAGFVWSCNSHEPRPGDNDKHEEAGA